MSDLLETFKEYIRTNGGRIKLGYKIVMESPEYFTPLEIKYFRTRYDEYVRAQNKYVRIRSDYWSAEDIAYLIQKYGRIKTSNLAEVLGRSPERVRQKFAEVATPEQKQTVAEIEHPWKKKSNFKPQLQ